MEIGESWLNLGFIEDGSWILNPMVLIEYRFTC
jgi:hypothetical protein